MSTAVKGSLSQLLSQTWWLLLLRGVVAVLFGLLCWMKPDISLAALVILFAAYALADGILAVVAAIQGRKITDDWWILLLWGLVGIAVGILTMMSPDVTALALLYYIAIWAIITGIIEIVAAIRVRKVVTGEGWLILAGILSVLFGIALFAQPGAGTLAVLWMIGIYAVAFGLICIILAFKSRSFVKSLT